MTTLPVQNQYTWQPLQFADLPAVHRLLAQVTRVDGRMPPDPLEDLQRQFHEPWSDPETDALVAITPEGEVAALARSLMNPNPETECRAYGESHVHPEHRGRQLEPVLLDWLEARGRQRLQAMPPHLPHELRFGTLDSLPDWLTALDQRGYQPVRHAYRMRRDLADPIPDQPWPKDLTLTPYRPELDESMRLALNEAFRDHWSFEEVTAEDWRLFFTGRSTWRPDLTFVALAGSEVAGLCMNLINIEGNRLQGFAEGWIGDLCVRRAWRKRGVASALLCESLRAFRAAGLDYAGLTVDTENSTGALRIYQAQGFAVYRRFVTFSKAITP